MSEVVEICKEFEVQIDFVKCSVCGKELSFEVSADNYGDLQISAEPHKCDEEG